MYFIRIWRAKDNKKHQLETMESNRNQSNGQLLETMKTNGKPKKESASAKKNQILMEMSKKFYENPMNIRVNFKTSKL